jgi:predicted nucleic acid-binding protein
MARIRPKNSVVCDAGPIIHLHELECLHLMEDFEKVLVPDAVREEVLKHRSVGFEDGDVNWVGISRRFPVEEPLRTMCQMFSLDAGEVAALEILSKEPDLIFLTDDAAARLVATRLGFRVHGTIGVLIRAIRRNLMKPERVIDALNRLPVESSLHIKASLLRQIICRLRQEFDV